MRLKRTQRFFTWKVRGHIDYTRSRSTEFHLTVVSRDFDAAVYLARQHMLQDAAEADTMIVDVDACEKLNEVIGWEP